MEAELNRPVVSRNDRNDRSDDDFRGCSKKICQPDGQCAFRGVNDERDNKTRWSSKSADIARSKIPTAEQTQIEAGSQRTQ